MPKPSKGKEICKLLLSQASKDMHEPLVPMDIPALAAHLTDVEFMYSDNKSYKLCGHMGIFWSFGHRKTQLTHLVEAIMRSFRDKDHPLCVVVPIFFMNNLHYDDIESSEVAK